MKRSGFARKVYVPLPRAPSRPLARLPNYSRPSALVSMPKENPLRSEEYRRLVAALPCIVCGVEGRSQAAHADQGKGMGLKTDDRTVYPACGAAPGRPGCHDTIGASGALSRDERRSAERLYGALTRARIISAGKWPAGLPMWVEIG